MIARAAHVDPRYPALLEINTRVRLTELSDSRGRAATLDDFPDAEIDRMAGMGFDWIWLLSVWQTGAAGRRVSLENPEWRKEFQDTLVDLTENDIAGSGFAITGYTVDPGIGGDEALARFRARLRERGMRLMLDFVPNHTALDHPWTVDHTDYYIVGSELDRVREPGNYVWVKGAAGDLLVAHGRDPNFPGWPDTLQLNYANPATQEAMIAELMKVARQCDGVRCDMAMLLLPDVFERTWGIRPKPFWPRATRCVRERFPGFRFMAEVYWDLEWTLQQQGFDYTYDKRLYDRLRAGLAGPVRDHLRADLEYQDHLARFLENHDEVRAATAFAREVHEAAAVVTFLTPGLRFFHRGQFEGRTKRISPHLRRAPIELANPELAAFYNRLLAVLKRSVVRDGAWQLLETVPAWEGNWTSDAFVAGAWQDEGLERLVAVVNYSPHQSQCYLRLPFADLGGGAWRFEDVIGDAVYERDGDDLNARGLYLDVRPWQYHVFELRSLRGARRTPLRRTAASRTKIPA